MITLNNLSDDEIKYLCDMIPSKDVRKYLRKNPEEFSKLKPGFRPTSILHSQTSNFLYENKSSHFISSFIEKNVKSWINAMEKYINKRMKVGDTKYQAYIRTFPGSYFANNIKLYFKLTREKVNDEVLEILTDISKILIEHEKKQNDLDNIKKKNEDNKTFKRKIKEKDNIIKDLKNKLSDKLEQINKLTNFIENKDEEISKLHLELEEIRIQINDLNIDNNNLEEKLIVNEKENALLTNSIDELNRKLIINEKDRFEIQIKYDDLKQSLLDKSYTINGDNTLLRPKLIDEFQEYLEYNFESLGLDIYTNEFKLFLGYLVRILFTGEPIILCRNAAHNLAKCVGNSLIGDSQFSSLAWTKECSAKNIVEFLNISKRVVCLDGFIGHFDELELFDILHNYKSKIIFVSFDYEKTLLYVAEEILILGNYLNLSMFGVFQKEFDIKEDPSVFEEEVYQLNNINVNKRFFAICHQIMKQLSFSPQVIDKYSYMIENEEILSQILMFTVLPYVVYIKDQNPYLLSKRLEKYAGYSGRSPYKEEFLKRYADE